MKQDEGRCAFLQFLVVSCIFGFDTRPVHRVTVNF